MKYPVVAFLLGVGLAGCVTDSQDLDVDGVDAALATDPLAPGANGTLQLPVLASPIDLWGEAKELLLFEGTIVVKECYGPENQALMTAFTLAFDQTVMFGCASYELPDGVLVPEGTKYLRIEADASGAQHAGEWYPYIITYGYIKYGDGHHDGEGTADAVKTWKFELKPKDWDIGGHAKSGYELGFWTWGNPASILYGPVKTKVVAERDPKWTPLPPLDHWQLKDRHRFVQDGVMTLVDHNASVKSSGTHEDLTGGYDQPRPVRLQDIIPLGTKQVAVVLKWTKIDGCQVGFECWISAEVTSGGHWWKNQVDQNVRDDRGWKIYVYDVPDQVGEDGPYVQNSTTIIWPFFYQNCKDHYDLEAACYEVGGGITRQADLRVIAEAWRGDVDLAALKERLGLG